MLVLVRERHQEILIGSPTQDVMIKAGEPIRVEVVSVSGNRVRLGVTAQRSIGVHRAEVWDAIAAEMNEVAEIEGNE